MFLEITESIWNSVEFYCCVFTAIIVVMYLAYRHKIRQIKRAEEIRQRIASDLHDDIGSTLSSISIMSKTAASDNGSGEKAANIFSTIGNASSQAMDLMSDIVWSVNPENDKMTNVIARMRQYASSILEASNISFKLEVAEKIEKMSLPMEKRRDFYLVFKEAVNNLAKYSHATQALLKLSFENNMLTLLVMDNGSGFNNDNQFAGNGLKNMKARTERLKGIFKIDSAINSGTQIILSVPLA